MRTESEARRADQTVGGASTGDARISIPIEVLPGPGGFQPSLSLEYSSDVADGVLGIGWQLAGLSEIRCSSRFGIQDYRSPGGCEFFELDGELLIGPVGNPDDHRYHTFVETFARIHYREESDTWEVVDTAGLTSIYGRSESRIDVGGTTVRWLLTEVTNSFDQSILISYESFGDLGVLYATEIAYGNRRVQFAYSTREDPIYGFRDGVETSLTRRMTEIRVLVDESGAVFKRFVLGFGPHPSDESPTAYDTNRSRLLWIQQFGWDCDLGIPDPVTSCRGLPVRRFDYRQAPGLEAWSSAPRWSVPFEISVDTGRFTGADYLLSGDLNGDGLVDFISDPPELWSGLDFSPSVYLNTGDGIESPSWAGSTADNESAVYTEHLAEVRFDRPKLSVDMVIDRSNSGNAGGAGASAAFAQSEPQPGGVELSSGLGTSGPHYTVSKVLWDGDSGTLSMPYPTSVVAPSWFQLADLDADGLADLIMSVRMTGVTIAYDEEGDPLAPGAQYVAGGQDFRLVLRNTGDPNDPWVPDPDLAAGLPAFGIVATESFATVWERYMAPNGINQTAFEDFNGCQRMGLGGHRNVGSDTGPNLFADFCINTVNTRPQFMDMNGDGYLDIVALESTDPDGFFFGPRNHWRIDYRYAELHTQVWLQQPRAEPGRVRWRKAPEFSLPFQHVYYAGVPDWDRGDATMGLPSRVSNDAGVRLVDINSDGLPDVVWADAYEHEDPPWGPQIGGPRRARGVLLNRGRGGRPGESVWCSSVALQIRASATTYADPITPVAVCPDAARFEVPAEAVFATSLTAEAGPYSLTRPLDIVDVNGDGKSDLVDSSSGDPTRLRTWLYEPDESSVWGNAFEGESFSPPMASEYYPAAGGLIRSALWVDINADGAVDFLSDGHPDYFRSFLSNAGFSDLLESYANGRGGSTTIEYVSAPIQRDAGALARLESEALAHSREQEIGERLTPGSPMVSWWRPRPLVAAVEQLGPGQSGVARTSYRYAHPRYCREERNRLGFRVVETTRPDGSRVKSFFYQNHGRAGRLSREEVWADTRLYRARSEVWEVVSAPNQISGAWLGDEFVAGSHLGRLVERIGTREYGPALGASTGTVNRTIFTYDDGYGYNFVARTDTIRPSGHLVEVRSPISDEEYGIRGLPAEISLFENDPQDTLLAHSTLAYVDESGVSTRGKVARRRDLIQPRVGSSATGEFRETQFGYDRYGNLTFRHEVEDESVDERTTRFCYDGDGGEHCPDGHGSHSLVVGVQDPLGNWEKRVPHPNLPSNRLLESAYVDAPHLEYIYDSFGGVEDVFMHRRSGETVHLAHTDHDYAAWPAPIHSETKFADESPSNFVWKAEIEDGFGGIWKTIHQVDPDHYMGVVQLEEPAAGRKRETYTLPCGNDVRCTNLTGFEEAARVVSRDAIGRAVRTQTPDGVSETFYTVGSHRGNTVDVAFEKNPNGALTKRFVDDDRQLAVEECFNAPDSTLTSVDLSGLSCEQSVGGVPNRTEYRFEASGELSSVADVFAVASGQLEDPAHVIFYRYDTLGRVLSVRDPNAGRSQSEWSRFGNLLSSSDARGSTRRYVYDRLNRVTSILTPDEEGDVRFAFGLRRLRATTSITSAGDSSPSSLVRMRYDDFGRMTTKDYRVDGLWLRTDWAYDNLGRLVRLTHPIEANMGRINTRYAYAGPRLMAVCQSTNLTGGCTSAPEVHFFAEPVYDGIGQLESYEAGAARRSFEYDPMSRRRTRDRSQSGSGELQFRYKASDGPDAMPSYDAMGNLTAVAGFSSYGGPRIGATYTYDARNRLASWQRAGVSSPSTYEYDGLGNLLSVGAETSRFDGSGPHAVSERADASGLFRYDYDPAGQLSRESQEGVDRHFSFDSAGRLKCVGSRPSGCDHLAITYAGDGSRIKEVAEGRTHYFGAEGFRYKPAQGGTLAESWIEVHAFEERIAYRHIKGARLTAESPFWTEQPPERFARWLGFVAMGGLLLVCIDPGLVLGRRRLPRRALGAFVVSSSLVFPPKVLAGGGGMTPTATATESAYRWVLSDLVGTSLVEFDESGALMRHVVSSPFGVVVEAFARDEAGRQFYAGHERQAETGLVYMAARWYDPHSRRFLSPDPILDLRSPQAHNAYSYVVNNPVNWTDPTGTSAIGDEAVRPDEPPEPPKKNFPEAINLGDEMIDQGYMGNEILGEEVERLKAEARSRQDAPGERSAVDGNAVQVQASDFPGKPESGTSANLLSYGLSVAGLFFEKGVAYAVDSHGNRQVFRVRTFGGDTEVLGGGLTTGRQITNAPNVYSLEGGSSSLGLAGGPYAYEAAVELNVGSNYIGVTIVGGAGLGFIPGGARAVRERWTPVPFQVTGGGN